MYVYWVNKYNPEQFALIWEKKLDNLDYLISYFCKLNSSSKIQVYKSLLALLFENKPNQVYFFTDL